jgi:hypothetical protein
MEVRRLCFLVVLSIASPAFAADGLVTSVGKAPITPDGDVAGAATDLVIDLDRSLDPAVVGRALPAGCSVRVTLPPAFGNTGLPVQDVFSAGCAPGNFQCITGIFLQGWPQHPILPHFPVPPLGPATEYALTPVGTNTLVFTALLHIAAPNPNPLAGPGLKQIHLINGFTNPARPGFYPVHVEFPPGPGCEAAGGVADVQIIPRIKPSLGVTSVFNPGAPNTIYQQTTAGNAAPFPWDFLLWDRKGGPLVDVVVEMVQPDFALLRQHRRAVGHISIHAPAGARGHQVTGGPSFAINAPIKGVPAGRLTVQFTAGSAPGRYEIEVALKGGNAQKMFVDVE